MKNIILKILFLIFTNLAIINKVNAGGILGHEGVLGSGLMGFDDIPYMIGHAINYFMGAAGMISVIFIIIGAYQILFGSISQNNSQGKNTIVAAIFGFIIAALAWVIIKLILDNFT